MNVISFRLRMSHDDTVKVKLLQSDQCGSNLQSGKMDFQGLFHFVFILKLKKSIYFVYIYLFIFQGETWIKSKLCLVPFIKYSTCMSSCALRLQSQLQSLMSYILVCICSKKENVQMWNWKWWDAKLIIRGFFFLKSSPVSVYPCFLVEVSKPTSAHLHLKKTNVLESFSFSYGNITWLWSLFHEQTHDWNQSNKSNYITFLLKYNFFSIKFCWKSKNALTLFFSDLNLFPARKTKSNLSHIFAFM